MRMMSHSNNNSFPLLSLNLEEGKELRKCEGFGIMVLVCKFNDNRFKVGIELAWLLLWNYEGRMLQDICPYLHLEK